MSPDEKLHWRGSNSLLIVYYIFRDGNVIINLTSHCSHSVYGSLLNFVIIITNSEYRRRSFSLLLGQTLRDYAIRH